MPSESHRERLVFGLPVTQATSWYFSVLRLSIAERDEAFGQ